ncbi:TonB-dependent receptor, partial [Escherichia coli]
SYTGTPMARFENYYNPQLRWETSRMINAALDFSTRNNRISGSVEYFTKKGNNLFGPAQLDYTTGVGYM